MWLCVLSPDIKGLEHEYNFELLPRKLLFLLKTMATVDHAVY